MMQVMTAQYDYNAASPDTLSFRRGEMVEVEDDKAKQQTWVRGRVKGTTKEGLLPRTYLTTDHYLAKEE